MPAISRPINKFTYDLFNALPKNDANVIISPLSIYCCLNIANLGAKSETAEELNKALHSDLIPRSAKDAENRNAGIDDIHSNVSELLKKWEKGVQDVILRVANKLLITNIYNVNDEYTRDLKKFYDVDVEPEDFVGNSSAILQRVNKWVSEVTNGKIEKILDYVDVDTVLIILNAVYFRGQWKYAFNPKRTELRTFYNFGKDAIQVAMMYQEDVFCDCYSFKIGNEELEVLELPYKGDASFTIILPKSQTFFNNLSEFDFDRLENKRHVCRTVDLMLPKMYFEANYNMNTPLSDLGIKNSFTSNADFSGITKSNGVYISRLLHKAVIEVNEEGTEAAAATAIVCDGISLTKCFFVNHPFLFFIKDKVSGVILFVGQVNKL